jgi:hypothetical protein
LQGSRPTPNLLSDGDLDDDKFFVFWEPDLIFPGENWEPLDYHPQPPAVKEKVTTEVRHFVILQSAEPIYFALPLCC